MTKKMLIDAAHPEEVRVALLSQSKVEDFDFESAARKPLRGNIYLARVTRVEPSLQAAFVEYGGNRHGFLAFSEIHPDYYQIPVSDRELLQQAEAEVADLAAKLELAQRGDEEDGDEDDETGPDRTAVANENGDAPDVDDDMRADDDRPDDEAAAEATGQGPANHADAIESDDAGPEAEEESEEEEEEEDKDDVKTDAHDDKNDDDAEDEPAGGGASAKTPYDPSEIADGEQPDVEIEDGADVETIDAAETDGQSGEDAFRDDHAGAPTDEEPDAETQTARAARNELFERYKEAKRKRSQLLRNYKIQEVVKRRQILLVQVVKEERGTKGAALTTYLSLAGRYCVLMPNTARGGGISRKIATASDRRRLRRVVDSLEVPQGMGLIIRTAGAKRTKTEIKRDYDYLLRLWENIRTLTLKSIAPCLIYEEASLIKRAIRDLYDKDISKVLVEGETGYREAKDFMKMLMPSHAKYVQPYKDRTPIFLKHNVEAQLDGMYQPSVRLKSGGYIVIHQTEALVAIDVNSGRSTRERNIELTALKTNIEAAQEAARQFRLRDLAGLIVIDFIDMEEAKNNRKVEKALKDALKSDRARIQISRISNFGLLELSRQRRRSGIVDGTTHACPTCSGAGVIRSHEMAALRILRAVEGEAISGKVGRIVARTSLDVSIYLLNHHRDWLKRIEENNGVSIEICADPDKAGDAYDLEKSGAPRERTDDATVIRADQAETIDSEGDEDVAQDDRESDRKRRKRRRRKKDAAPRAHDKDVRAAEDEADESQAFDEDNEKQAAGDDNGEAEKPKRRRRRGRRGGKRSRRTADQNDPAADADTEFAASRNGARQDALVEDGAEDAAATADVSDPDPTEDAPDDATDDATDDAAEIAPEDASEAATESGGANDDRASGVDAEPEAPLTEPKPAPEDPEVAPAPKKPAKKGWWQRVSSA